MSILDKIINISKKTVEEKYSHHLNISNKLKLSELELTDILVDSFNNNNWKEGIDVDIFFTHQFDNRSFNRGGMKNMGLRIVKDK